MAGRSDNPTNRTRPAIRTTFPADAAPLRFPTVCVRLLPDGLLRLFPADAPACPPCGCVHDVLRSNVPAPDERCFVAAIGEAGSYAGDLPKPDPGRHVGRSPGLAVMLPLLVGALVAAGLCVPAIGLLRKRRRAAALRRRPAAVSTCPRCPARSNPPVFGSSASAVSVASRGPLRPQDTLPCEALARQLQVWDRLLEKAYHTCNPGAFFRDFKVCAESLGDDRSLFVLLQYVVNRRDAGLVDRLRALHPALTEYELDMLCMIRFGFSFNCIRLLHHHENVNSLYSRRTKIHRKMGLASRYPLEDYLSELAAEGQTERNAL